MKKTFLLSFILFISYWSFAQQNQTTTVYFKSAQSDLTLIAQNKIDDALISLGSQKNLKILIKAHTDSEGTASYNNELSTLRAEKVLNYLVSKGIDPYSIQVEPFGENLPIASNEDAKGKANNRRVEITFTYETPVLPLKTKEEIISHQEVEAIEVIPNEVQKEVETKSVQTRQTLSERFQVPTKKQQINPAISNTLTLDEKGTKLYIPANSLVHQNGEPVTETVTIHYKEYRNSADMVFSGIPMTYHQNGEEFLFNSAGMFEIEGTVGDEPVEVKDGQVLKIDYGLARQNFDADFYQLDETGNNWTRTQEIQTTQELRFRTTGWFTEKRNYAQYTVSSPSKAKLINRNEVILRISMKCNFSEEDSLITVFYGEEIIAEGAIINDKFQGKINRKWKKEEKLIEIQKYVDSYFWRFWARETTAELTNESIVYGLALSGFGVYNCDQIYRIKSPLDILAICLDEESNEIQNFANLSMIDLKYNGAFLFNIKSFTARKAGSIALVLTTTDEKLYVLTGKDYQAMRIRESGEYTFKFKDMTEHIKSNDDLAKYLKL